MNEFIKKARKVNVTIKVDPCKLKEAKAKNINISKVSRDALDKALDEVPYPSAEG